MRGKNEKGSLPITSLSVWDFISLISHQLRNPLASTKLSLEMLLSEDLGPLNREQKDYLEMILEDNEHMIRLVKEFLTVSAIERGEITLNTEKTDLRMLVLDVVRELKAFATAHNVVLNFVPPEHLPLLEIDKIKVREVINNFIDNAIKYSRGGGAVDIQLEENKEEKALTFTCRDSGIGIPEKDKERVSEKFFRAENAASLYPEGTGIGLYMNRAIIEKSGGKIGFESEEGKGSTFWFTLPIK